MTQEGEEQLLGLIARIMHALEAIAKKQNPKFEPLGKPPSAAERRRA